jgi:SAM-dependent methyltransferase
MPGAGATVSRVDTDDWLDDTRTSYDNVAVGYAEQVDGILDGDPLLRAALTAFADTVLAAGGGPVADVGCGPGHVTARLRDLGLDAFGIDLSPAMIELARRAQPGVRFDVGSMTDLRLPDASLAGLIAFWSLIHVPDHAVPGTLAQFRRVLRPGGHVLVGFHVGDASTLKTEGYGGHPMHVYVHKRRPDHVADLLREAGFAIDAQLLIGPDASRPGAILYAHLPA